MIDKIRLYDKMMNAQTIAVIANDAEQDLTRTLFCVHCTRTGKAQASCNKGH